MYTSVGFIHFHTCAYPMTELGFEMGHGMFFFLHIERENQPLTDYTHLQNVLTYHNRLQYYAQHIVHMLVQQR